MDFQDFDRVTYDKHQLIEVLFQIRFPRELQVETKLPSDFQNDIKYCFPLLETKTELSLIINPSNLLPNVGEKRATYDFLSVGRDWKLALNSEFIALTTNNYTNWQEFSEKSDIAIKAIINNYEPQLFTRIGLRYKGVIRKNELGLDDVEWKELISEPILGILFHLPDPQYENVSSYESRIAFKVDDINVSLECGYVFNQETNYDGFLIDIDLYKEEEVQTDARSSLEELESFHKLEWKIFRWCITDRLHAAMQPQPT